MDGRVIGIAVGVVAVVAACVLLAARMVDARNIAADAKRLGADGRDFGQRSLRLGLRDHHLIDDALDRRALSSYEWSASEDEAWERFKPRDGEV